MNARGNNLTGTIGLAFANALASGDFDAAHQMLTSELQRELPPALLREQYKGMFSYAGTIIGTDVALVETDDMDGWEIKEPGDVGWAYVAIDGQDQEGSWSSEAVSVIVSKCEGAPLIRLIDWGRP